MPRERERERKRERVVMSSEGGLVWHCQTQITSSLCPSIWALFCSIVAAGSRERKQPWPQRYGSSAVVNFSLLVLFPLWSTKKKRKSMTMTLLRLQLSTTTTIISTTLILSVKVPSMMIMIMMMIALVNSIIATPLCKKQPNNHYTHTQTLMH